MVKNAIQYAKVMQKVTLDSIKAMYDLLHIKKNKIIEIDLNS